MSEGQSQPSGPDLAQGLSLAEFADGAMLLGHVGDQAVLLARRGQEVFAIGATCTHYGGPLAEGLLVGDTVRCPWHHACFSLRTGEALRPPALNPVACWRVERQGDRIFVREKARGCAEAGAAVGGRHAGINRHPGRRRGGQQRRRDAAPRGLCRQHYDAERRFLGALRPAEFVEGLSRRQRVRRVDPAALAGLLPEARHRAASRRARRGNRHGATRGPARGRQPPALRRAPHRHRRRAGAARCARRRAAAHPLSALARR